MERRACRDGSSRGIRLNLLMSLASRQDLPASSSISAGASPPKNPTFARFDSDRLGTEISFENGWADAECAATALAWQSVMLEVLVTIVLETELDACVALIEALKFWRQLAQMTKFRRRVYYPALHLREGGIRRTALRRAARLEGMLHHRAAKASALHDLLLRVRALPESIIDPCAAFDDSSNIGRHRACGSMNSGESRAMVAQRAFLSRIDDLTEETLATIHAVFKGTRRGEE